MDKAETTFVSYGHPMADAYECMACHTDRTGESMLDVLSHLLDHINTDPFLPADVKAEAEILRYRP